MKKKRVEEQKKKIEQRKAFIEKLMEKNRELFSPPNRSIQEINEENYTSRDEEDLKSLEQQEKVLFNFFKKNQRNVVFFEKKLIKKKQMKLIKLNEARKKRFEESLKRQKDRDVSFLLIFE